MLLTEPVASPLSTTNDAGNSASLNTAAKSNLGDRVLDEVGKDNVRPGTKATEEEPRTKNACKAD